MNAKGYSKDGVDWALARLQEQSTWKAIIGFGTVIGIVVQPQYVEAVIAVGIALVSAINFFRNETKEVQNKIKEETT